LETKDKFRTEIEVADLPALTRCASFSQKDDWVVGGNTNAAPLRSFKSASQGQRRKFVQRVTLVKLEARYRLISDANLSEGLPFSEQPTLILPVVRDIHKSIQAKTQFSETQDYISLVSNLVKSSGIYAIASLAPPLVALALAPFLTRSLSQSDYGALIVLNTVIILITAITQLGLSSAVFRVYNYDFESRKDRKVVIATTTVLLIISSLPITIVIVIFAPWLANLLLGSSSYAIPVQVAALVMIMQNLSVPGMSWLRAENRAKIFSLLSIINVLITLGANVILVGIAHMGITGSLLATGAGNAIVVICTLPLILFRIGLVPRLDITNNLLSFGLPFVFNSMSFWVLQFSDRYLLSRLGSLEQTANYGVAYTLGGALNAAIIAPFILAWPATMFVIAKRKDASKVFQLVFRWYSKMLLLATFAFTLVAIVVLNILFPASYHSSASIIPIIAISNTFYGLYTIFTVGINIRRKTWLIALAMVFTALINVGCNFILIPLYGSVGAALSTLIAYVFLAVLMYIVNQLIYPIPFEIGIFTIELLVGIAIFVSCSLLTQHQTIYGACVIYVVSTVIYGICLALLGKLATRSIKSSSGKSAI
jgi:O-antigen/teichoic acid export membrane protein